MSLSYEEQRLQNIRDNQALLLSLGLAPLDPPKKRTSAASGGTKKKAKATSSGALRTDSKKHRDADEFKPGDSDGEHDDDNDLDEDDSNVEYEGRKAPRTPKRRSAPSAQTVDTSGLRRSARSTRGVRDLSSAAASPVRRRGKSGPVDDDASDDEGDRVKMRNNPRLGERIHDPKTFGAIPGVEVGRWWSSRMEASRDAIHAPFVAGISGNAIDGAYSVALSGGYPDDVDLGYAFTYTGCGGRDLKGTKNAPKNLRTAPQTFDQSFTNPMNAALKRSAETRKPVRVIRGFKLDSLYAPEEGYRYDGLYVVERAWMAQGLTKRLLVCRYAFKRLEGQDPLPVRSERSEAGDEAEEQEPEDGESRNAAVAEQEEREDDSVAEAANTEVPEVSEKSTSVRPSRSSKRAGAAAVKDGQPGKVMAPEPVTPSTGKSVKDILSVIIPRMKRLIAPLPTRRSARASALVKA